MKKGGSYVVAAQAAGFAGFELADKHRLRTFSITGDECPTEVFIGDFSPAIMEKGFTIPCGLLPVTTTVSLITSVTRGQDISAFGHTVVSDTIDCAGRLKDGGFVGLNVADDGLSTLGL